MKKTLEDLLVPDTACLVHPITFKPQALRDSPPSAGGENRLPDWTRRNERGHRGFGEDKLLHGHKATSPGACPPLILFPKRRFLVAVTRRTVGWTGLWVGGSSACVIPNNAENEAPG